MILTLTALMATCAPYVHPDTLRALIAVESAGNPYAVSLNRPMQLASAGREAGSFIPAQPRSPDEALQLASDLLAQGITISVGLAQINIENLSLLDLKLADLFDPCANLQAAQRILLDCDRAQGLTGDSPVTRLQRTLSCYNAGNFQTGLSNGYVSRIAVTAERQRQYPPAPVEPSPP